MDNLSSWWSFLPLENRVIIIAGIFAAVIGGLAKDSIIAGIKRIFGKKDSTPPTLQTVQQQVIVNVQSPQVVAPEPPRGDGQPQGLPLQFALIPRAPQYGFVARYNDEGNDLVARVSEFLNQNRAVALIGSGGLGKTTLAAEIVRHLLPSPVGDGGRAGDGGRVVWASADGRVDFSLGTLLDEAASQLDNPDVRTLALEKKIDAVRRLLAGRVETLHATSLLVIDNFETIAAEQQKAIADFVNTLSCAVLVTSRAEVQGAERVNIGAMSPKEAQDFLTRWIASSKKKNALTPLIDEIAKLGERNPMVMRWIVGQLERAQRMSDVLDELSRGQGDAATRVFGRSFGLLNEDAQATLLSLALFVPSANRTALAFTAGFGEDIKRLNDALKPLADLQLLETDAKNECLSVVGLTRRFTMAQLNKDSSATEYRKRFVDYFVNYAEANAETTPEDFDALEDERENLLAAMDTCIRGDNLESAFRFVDAVAFMHGTSAGFFFTRGHWGNATKWIDQTLRLSNQLKVDFARDYLTHLLAVYHTARGDYLSARILLEEVAQRYRDQADYSNLSSLLRQLGNILNSQGDHRAAQQCYEEGLQIATKLGDQSETAGTLHQLAMIAQDQGDYEVARARYAESLETFKKLGAQREQAIVLHQLALIAQDQGDYETARQRYAESLDIAKKLGDQSQIAITSHNLGMLAEIDGNKIEAARMFREALEIFERLKSPDAKLARESLERVTQDAEGTKQ